MQLKDGSYQYTGGIDALSIAEKYGCPVYVYDFDIIKRQYNRLHSAFEGIPFKINYACKALTNINILRLVRSLGAGLDAVAVQEVKLGLRAGFTPDQILYTPNCVSIEEMTEVVGLGVKVNVDNISMLEQFGQHFEGYPLCLRINPHIMAGGNSKISTGHIDSKFGISFHQLPLVERIIKATGIKVCLLYTSPSPRDRG